MPAAVRTGLDVQTAENFAALRGLRVALLVHQASVDSKLRHIIDLVLAAPDVTLVRVFAPEHGLHGAAQDQISLANDVKSKDFELVNLYGDSFDSLWPDANLLKDVDALVIDLQDVGSRYYTFYTSAAFCMERAAEAGTRVIVLDRPNPIGGQISEGPILDDAMRSFVGWYNIPARHGMTIGEVLTHINLAYDINCELEVTRMEGWKRSMHFRDTGLPWVAPSPNMPTPETTLVYPGGCLIEGTNLSEGRGTTQPFEIFGAPFIDGKALADALVDDNLQGVAFRPLQFEPTFHKWTGQSCGGIQVHVTNRETFRPWLTYTRALVHIYQMRPEFAWRTEPYEYVSDRPAIDLLFGNAEIGEAVENGAEVETLAKWDSEEREKFDSLRRDIALYPFENSDR